MVNTSGSLLGDTKAALEHLWVFVVDEGSKISTIIEDKVKGLAVLEGGELLLEAPLVFLLSLALPGKAVSC